MANEIATVNSFQLVTGLEGMDPELLAELQDEMEDLDEERGISCRQIKVPSGGGKAYEVEGDNPDDPEMMKEIDAVIVFTHRLNTYWEGEFGSADGPQLPTCSSMDAKTGLVYETGEVRDCESCPYNKYAEDGTGKACKNIRRVYMMISGMSGLYMLSIPPSSIKDVNKQLARIMSHSKIPYTRMVMRFKLEQATNKNNIKYSKVTVEKVGMLPADLFATTATMRKELKEKYAEVAITSADYNVAAAPEDKADFVQAEAVDETVPFN